MKLEVNSKVLIKHPKVKKEYQPKTEIEKELFEELAAIVKERFGEEYIDNLELEHPDDESYGDFSTNIAMKLAGQLKENPKDVAEKIVTSWNSKKFGKPQIAGAGFLNFMIDKSHLAKAAQNMLKLEENSGKVDVNSGKRYMVEFSQPNPMKAFHIGHLKGTLYGESLSRIFEATGIDVIRANYQGDVGLHIAKIMWAVMQEYPVELPSDLEGKSLGEKVDFIQDFYVKGARAYEENESAKGDIDKLNNTVNNKDKSVQKYYKPFRQWSLDKFEEIYERLDVRFDRYYYESETIGPAFKHVEDAIKKGILEREESGSVVFRGEKYGLHTRVFVNKVGQPTYEGKDLELGYLEATEHGKLDKHLFLIGAEQKDYLKVVFKVRELLFGDLMKDKQEHVVNGFVNVKGIKMSSRTGVIVKAEDILNTAVDAISKVVAKRDYSKNEKKKISETLGVGSVKYSILSTNPSKDATIDLEESVSVNGQSAPYIIYAYTRAKSILRESGGIAQQVSINADSYTTDSEMDLFRTLYKFPEAVQIAAENYAPNHIAEFIFNLAQKYNSFYQECPVLKAEEDVKKSRLLLTAATARVIIDGLYLLGIETLERM